MYIYRGKKEDVYILLYKNNTNIIEFSFYKRITDRLFYKIHNPDFVLTSL